MTSKSTVQSRRAFVKSIGWMAGAAILVACGSGESTSSGPPTATPPAAGSGGAVTLQIESIPAGSRFSTEKLEAPAGSKITLTFKNATTEVAKAYNWVLLKPNSQMRVVNNALEAGESAGFLKEGDPEVIAHTKLIKGGESDTISFDAPPPGAYPYLSTTPGVHAVMKGVLTIK